jgi:predicted nucleic acid-binding protein
MTFSAISGRKTKPLISLSPPYESGGAMVIMPDAGCVVDTDVLSYLFRRDTRAEPYRPYITGRILAVSFMTLAELERWALQRDWGPVRRERMADFLSQFIVILVDHALCKTWAAVADQARRNGRPIQVGDAWIAATAISLNVPLITNNRRDFTGIAELRLLPQV